MGFWSKLRGKPPDALTIHRIRHTFASADVLTFITEGLARHDAQEIRITVPAAWPAERLTTIETFLRSLRGLAADGRPALVGGWTLFKSPAFPGDVGILYARPRANPDVPGSESALVAVGLHREEVELAMHGYGMRILGLLADRSRIFPYPECWEIRDEPIVDGSAHAATLLEQAPRLTTGELWVTVSERDGATAITVSLGEAEIAKLAASWPADLEGLALMARLAPDADAQSIWRPGQTERSATTRVAAPERIGHAFLMLVRLSEGAGELTFAEDGVGLTLDPATFTRVRDALLGGASTEIAIAQTRLVIAVRGAPEHIKLISVELGASDAEMRANIEPPALARFIVAIQAVVVRVAREQPVAADVRLGIHVVLKPGEPMGVQVAFNGPEPALLAALHRELLALTPVEVRGQVPLRLELSAAAPRPPRR